MRFAVRGVGVACGARAVVRASCYLGERLPALSCSRWAVWGGRGWSRWWCWRSLVLAGPGWTPQHDIAGARARLRPPS
eukprot:2191198-Pyramimonas_sp.AAC.1